MTEANSFDVLKEISRRNGKIKSFNLFNNLKEAGYINKNRDGRIVMLVDPATIGAIHREALTGEQTIMSMLLVVDKEEFEKVKKELEEASDESG